MHIIAFIARYFLVFLLLIEIALLPIEVRFLLGKSKRVRAKSGELLDFAELAVLFNILVTLVLAIVVVITQAMMF